MTAFPFQEYYIKACIVPLILYIIALFLLVLTVLWSFHAYRKSGSGSFLKDFARFGIPTILSFFIFISANCIAQTLQYGVFMLGEKEGDAVFTVGKIENIDIVSMSPMYKLDNGESVDQTAVVKVDGIKYYFMSAIDLQKGEIIGIQYLPNSKIVLSCRQATYSEWTPPVTNQENEYNIPLIIFFIVVIIFFGILSRGEYIARLLERRILLADQIWSKSEVRHHKSYLLLLIGFLSIVVGLFAFCMFQYRTLAVLPMFLIVILIASVMGLYYYKTWCLEYNEKELRFHNIIGPKFQVISVENIVSIQKVLENSFLTKGKMRSIVLIKYQYSFQNKILYGVIKLDFRYHVGIRRFLETFHIEDISIL